MSHHTPKHIIIVGAGIGGLSAAIRLVAQGHNVHVLERQPQVGGKLNQVVMQGFSFDTGPSLITMPDVLRDLFQSAQRCLGDYLELVPLNVTCRYFYRDGLVLNAWKDQQRLAQELPGSVQLMEMLCSALLPTQRRSTALLRSFPLSQPRRSADVMGTFVRYVLRGHASLVANEIQARGDDTSSVLARLQSVLAALSPTTFNHLIETFFRDSHIQQLFKRYATYNGSSPYQVASVYSIIPYVELSSGGWHIKGGIYTLALALEKLARELGVSLTLDCDVRRILVERGEARGVVLADGRVLRADVVIANSDVVTTQRELLSPAVRNERSVQRLERLEPSCSGFVLMLGVNKRYPQLSHHNIFFSMITRLSSMIFLSGIFHQVILRSISVPPAAAMRRRHQRDTRICLCWSMRRI